MKPDIRKVLLTVFGAVVDVALVAVWAVLVFAPEPVLSRVELRLAFPILFALAMVYSWLKKTWQPEQHTPKAVKIAAVVMIAVLLIRLMWITFA